MTALRAVGVAEPSTQSRLAVLAYPRARSTRRGANIWMRFGSADEHPANWPKAGLASVALARELVRQDIDEAPAADVSDQLQRTEDKLVGRIF